MIVDCFRKCTASLVFVIPRIENHAKLNIQLEAQVLKKGNGFLDQFLPLKWGIIVSSRDVQDKALVQLF